MAVRLQPNSADMGTTNMVSMDMAEAGVGEPDGSRRAGNNPAVVQRLAAELHVEDCHPSKWILMGAETGYTKPESVIQFKKI